MRKSPPILLLLSIVLIAWLYLSKQAPQKPLTTEQTNEVVQPSPQQQEASQVEITPHTSPANTVPELANTIESSGLINALAATNLEQWKAAIEGLKPLAGFKFQQHWLVEQRGRTNGIPIGLSLGNNTIQYKAALISIEAKNETGDIMEVEMQTPNMNIDDTRDLGLKLCNMLDYDSKDFLAWCDKVGNRWLDAPLYAGGNRNYSFQILRGYNDEKPWIINFMITPNP